MLRSRCLLKMVKTWDCYFLQFWRCTFLNDEANSSRHFHWNRFLPNWKKNRIFCDFSATFCTFKLKCLLRLVKTSNCSTVGCWKYKFLNNEALLGRHLHCDRFLPNWKNHDLERKTVKTDLLLALVLQLYIFKWLGFKKNPSFVKIKIFLQNW